MRGGVEREVCSPVVLLSVYCVYINKVYYYVGESTGMDYEIKDFNQ